MSSIVLRNDVLVNPSERRRIADRVGLRGVLTTTSFVMGVLSNHPGKLFSASRMENGFYDIGNSDPNFLRAMGLVLDGGRVRGLDIRGILDNLSIYQMVEETAQKDIYRGPSREVAQGMNNFLLSRYGNGFDDYVRRPSTILWIKANV